MLLAVDCGNTNTVFAVFGGDGDLLGEWRTSTSATRTADEYGVWLTNLLALSEIKPEQITAAIIASVVPDAVFALKGLVERYFDCTPMMVGDPDVDLGTRVKVDNPAEVGADRVVNAVAAHAKYGGPLVIVDFGTATTFDAIDEDGAYLGGVIAPGINLSLEALHRAAAQLPLIGVEKTEKVIGRSTVAAMKSGVFWGYVGLIDGIVARIKGELGARARVIATGGLAPLFLEATECLEVTDANLTLEGLYAIYRKNT